MGVATSVKLLLIPLLLILVAGLCNIALAAPPGTYTVSVVSDHVSVGISGSMFQNVTTTTPFAYKIDRSNSTVLARQLNSSLQQLDPRVWVDSPSLSASSNGTILAYSLNFSVFGTVRSYFGGSESADLAWRSFNIPEAIPTNGFGFNLVGKSELGQGLVTLAKNSLTPTPGHIETVTFQIGSARVTPLQIEQEAPKLNLLDFSTLSSPLDSWSQGFDLNSQMTTWTGHAGFDVLAKISVTEAMGQSVTSAEEALYSVETAITVPGLASSRGSLIFFGSNILDPVFAAVILITLPIGVIVYLADGRLTSSQRQRQRRK